MRNHLLTLTLTVLGIFSMQAQDATLAAFSGSYEAEYHENYIEAVEIMEAVYDENSYEMNLRLGWLSYMAAKHTKSMDYYKKAMTQKPNSIEAKLGFVYPAAASDNMNDVIDTYKNILKLDPSNSVVNYRLAYLLYNADENADALTYVESVLKSYPFDFDANYLAGQIYAGMEKDDKAKASFERALLYSPGSLTVQKRLKNL